MATFDYNEILALGAEVIAEFGGAAQLKRGADLRDCVVVEVDYSPNERDGQVIQFTDRRFLMSPASATTQPDSEEDKLVVDNETLRIVTAKRVKPASVNVLWDLQVRR